VFWSQRIDTCRWIIGPNEMTSQQSEATVTTLSSLPKWQSYLITLLKTWFIYLQYRNVTSYEFGNPFNNPTGVSLMRLSPRHWLPEGWAWSSRADSSVLPSPTHWLPTISRWLRIFLLVISWTEHMPPQICIRKIMLTQQNKRPVTPLYHSHNKNTSVSGHWKAGRQFSERWHNLVLV
jgi:hypothetical protein